MSWRSQLPRYRHRRRGWVIAAVMAVAIAALALFWPRGPVYAQCVDGLRPTVVFIWSDPTPHHPYG